jgi:hypothetical protein
MKLEILEILQVTTMKLDIIGGNSAGHNMKLDIIGGNSAGHNMKLD